MKGTIQERFYAKVDVRGEDECWEWLASKRGNGYGGFGLEGKTIRAHRLAYALAYGEIPPGIYVLHRCDNRVCVNPKHLFLGTQKENIRDMMDKGRGVRAGQSGEGNIQAKLKRSQAEEIRRLYGTGFYTKTHLAAIYMVSRRLIYSIVRGDSWK